MRKIIKGFRLTQIAKPVLIFISILALSIYPKEIGTGIKTGLTTLYETIIPSLFPFMILSSYASDSHVADAFARKLFSFSKKAFKVNPHGIIAFLLGILGGYPIGAKSLAEFYENKKLNNYDVRKLFCWCINPSPAFAITAVGTFMLGSTKSGIIIYISILISSLCIGLCIGFLNKNFQCVSDFKEIKVDSKHIFINSVAKGNSAMLSVCGWILIFSGISASLEKVIPNEYASLFFNSITEVTNGCKVAISHSLPLPAICAILSFGGLAVIFQIGPYLEKCNISFKEFFCWRVVNGSLSAFLCSQLLRIFPDCQTVFSNISIGNTTLTTNHSLFTAFMMILMCTVFVFEVDNRKKV